MKFIFPLVFFAGLMMQAPVQAHAPQAPSYSRTQQKNSMVDYCTEERFQSYVELATAMRDYVTPMEYQNFYIPLKKKAAKAKIILKNFGPLSARSHAALLDIVHFVARNEAHFEALWEVEAFNNVATDLFEMTTSLTRDLE